MSNISMNDFLKVSHSVNIIDIRSVQNYNNNHIPNARNIPFEKLLIKPEDYLNRNSTYYIYCQQGIKSQKATEILRKMGYNVVNIDGGYEAWILSQ